MRRLFIMGGIYKKQGSVLVTSKQAKRRLHLIFLFCCALFIFILILIWQLRGQAIEIYTSLSNVIASEQHSTKVVSANLQDSAVTYDKIDPTVWETISRELPSLTVNNYSPSNVALTGLYVRPSDQPAAGDISGTFNTGLFVNPDAVALGTDTTGDYIAGLLAGNGLTVSGSGGEATSLTISLDTANANNWTGTQTFTNGFTLNGNTYNNLAGTGLSFSNGTLLSILGVSIDSSEIVDGTVIAADILDGTLTLTKLGQNGCGTNEVISWGGSAWACTADTDTNTTYTAGSGLSLTGTTFSIESSLAMFKTIDASLGTDPIADSLTDTLTLSGSNGITVTGDAATDGVDFSLNVAIGGGLTITGNALTLLDTCSNNQYLAWASVTSSWECVSAASAPNTFQTIAGDSGNAVADSIADTVTVTGGNGLTSVSSDTSDTVTFDVDLASGSGLAFSGGGLTLQSCADGQILKRVSGSWACAPDGDTSSAASYKQQLAGTDNVTVGASPTPLLTNGSGVAQSLGITIAAGNEVSLAATVELSSSLATGPVVYTLVRDDNQDNDCAIGGGDGTQIGGQVTSFIASVAQSFTTSFNFADSSPIATTSYYQLCASTSIALGTATVADRALTLTEINL